MPDGEPATATDRYAAGFARRCAWDRGPGRPTVDEPGLHGLLSSDDQPTVRLLVTDDRAHDRLDALLPDAPGGTVTVLVPAARCAARVAAAPGWTTIETATAMVRRDLEDVPTAELPGGLVLRPVRRDDDPDGVPFERAVACVMRANAESTGVAEDLRSFPPTVRLLAAVDGDGVVRGTAGFDTFGDEAVVLAVDTDPGWRARGIAQAVTAAALRAARDAGARRASLVATDMARGVYGRLGFETVDRVTRFRRR